MSRDIFILLLEKSHVGRPVHLEINLVYLLQVQRKKGPKKPKFGHFSK